MPDRPEDRRLLEEIFNVLEEPPLLYGFDEKWRRCERILELVSLDAERREREFIPVCNKYCHLHTGPYPICSSTQRDAKLDRAGWCKVCGHERLCHAESEKAGPCCATCGKVRDDHPDHDFEMPRPEGCVCGEPWWQYAPAPICDAFKPEPGHPALCATCEHDEGCHRRRAYQRPSVTRRDAERFGDTVLVSPSRINLKLELMESGTGDVDAGRAARRLAEERR